MTDLNQKLYTINRQDEEEQTFALAKSLDLEYVDLVGYPFAADIFTLFPATELLQFRFAPYLKIGKEIRVAIVDKIAPEQEKFFADYIATNKAKFKFAIVSKTGLAYAINEFSVKQESELAKSHEISERQDDLISKVGNVADIIETAKKISTTDLLDLILFSAAKMNASDVHIEPGENDFLIRYRIDGILEDIMRMPLSNYKFLLSRIKFLAKLKMDVSGEPQDGRFSIKRGENAIDLRVSALPSAFGESVVIRLLGQEMSIKKLADLGFRPDAMEIIGKAIARPHGMILNTGPTGSGKSTTLYAMIMELKKPGIKIISLEDPIEYRIAGVEQSQVDPEGGYTFAGGLRAALRQDPDILMVGEIRDQETAEIAVQAALTGHLLLSTLHSNTAAAALPRLLEIGVRPFLLAGSINLIMGQRLVRKLCPKCAVDFAPTEVLWEEIKKIVSPIKDKIEPQIAAMLEKPAAEIKLKKAVGCLVCGKTGFAGRQVIVEVLVPTAELESLIGRQATIAEFTKISLDQGMITMEQDGLIKVLQGLTTSAEVWRVTKD
ncbi:MAG: GspE/PulE family protein [Candidatus Berkelbacteria bacterium]|nr:GspE/PulE family protein [Candidatus Berkelbacteria bacterium]